MKLIPYNGNYATMSKAGPWMPNSNGDYYVPEEINRKFPVSKVKRGKAK